MYHSFRRRLCPVECFKALSATPLLIIVFSLGILALILVSLNGSDNLLMILLKYKDNYT